MITLALDSTREADVSCSDCGRAPTPTENGVLAFYWYMRVRGYLLTWWCGCSRNAAVSLTPPGRKA